MQGNTNQNKIKGFSLSLSTWVICSHVFRVKSFDIDSIILLYDSMKYTALLNVLISSVLLRLWCYRFNVYHPYLYAYAAYPGHLYYP